MAGWLAQLLSTGWGKLFDVPTCEVMLFLVPVIAICVVIVLLGGLTSFSWTLFEQVWLARSNSFEVVVV